MNEQLKLYLKNPLIIASIIIALVIGFIVVTQPFFIVREGEQAVVTQFQALQQTIQEPGLYFKAPVVNNVVVFPNKILPWDGEAQKVPADGNFVFVDTTARWRIADLELFYEKVRTIQQAYGRLDEKINTAVRTVISNNPLMESVRDSNYINQFRRGEPIERIISDESILEEIEYEGTVDYGRSQLKSQMEELVAESLLVDFGIELIDIVIRRISYTDDLTQSVYNNMEAERKQLAAAIRSDGQGQKQAWLGRLDREKQSELSAARADAEEIKGTADATAANIYAQAYNRDPDFYAFWRAIESYRLTLPKFDITLTTDMDYFSYLYNEDGN